MMLVITGVGSLIHLYSTEYMEQDRDYRRFFAEMNFFVFSMLLLVEAANFLFLIVGWAFVGLASYLLIGFYYQRPTAVAAAKKAFVINVIGDVGMVLAAFLLVAPARARSTTRTSSPPRRRGSATAAGRPRRSRSCFRGRGRQERAAPAAHLAARRDGGPDPGQRPDPRGDHGHGRRLPGRRAATCSTTSRPGARTWSPWIGGADRSCWRPRSRSSQEDIKRVLAYRTVSQIGYMLMGAGLGRLRRQRCSTSSTHAFFKALLFLAAGIVIHALDGRAGPRRMGGLRQSCRSPT